MSILIHAGSWRYIRNKPIHAFAMRRSGVRSSSAPPIKSMSYVLLNSLVSTCNSFGGTHVLVSSIQLCHKIAFYGVRLFVRKSIRMDGGGSRNQRKIGISTAPIFQGESQSSNVRLIRWLQPVDATRAPND